MRPRVHGHDTARHRVHFDLGRAFPAVALNPELIQQPTPLPLEVDALHSTGDSLQRDRASGVFIDLRFGNEAVWDVVLHARRFLSGEASSSKRQPREQGECGKQAHILSS